jgi:hypothetical protein
VTKPARPSINPVLDHQARHLAKVLEVAGDQRGPVRQGDAGDEQVAAADLLQALDLA